MLCKVVAQARGCDSKQKRVNQLEYLLHRAVTVLLADDAEWAAQAELLPAVTTELQLALEQAYNRARAGLQVPTQSIDSIEHEFMT